jgi:hypothetical protein
MARLSSPSAFSRDPFHPSYLPSVKDASADTQSRYSAPRESGGWHKRISREGLNIFSHFCSNGMKSVLIFEKSEN